MKLSLNMEKNEESNLININELVNSKKQKNVDVGNEKVRLYIFDNFKGILIFMVVFAHFLFDYSSIHLNSLSRKIVVFIYSFHMQAFIFISGYFSTDNSIKLINAIKLLILYYIFNFSFSLFLFYYLNFSINFLEPQNSYWYLLSLFTWRISIKFISDLQFIFIISVIIALLEGYWDCFTNVLSIERTIAFFPYFIAGYKMQKINKFIKFLIFKKGNIKYYLYIISFICISYFTFLFINKNIISNSVLLMKRYRINNGIKERLFLMIISSIMILFFLLIIPNIKILFLSKIGKNSLYIFLFHRIFTFITQKNLFIHQKFSNYIITYSFIFSLINCNSILNGIHKNFFNKNLKGKIINFTFCLSFILLLSINPIKAFIGNFKSSNNNIKIKTSSFQSNLAYNDNLKNLFKNSIRISYIGDLILLKDQVIVAKNNLTGKYEFEEMFQYTSKHFHESDFSIGVYEGPSAGNNTSFSTSNYGDGIPLALNFPDEFAESVKKAGINFVTTANNHLLDKNINGAMRTLNILDKFNILHIGSYRNQEEKNKIKMINIKGINIAFLAYTSSVNYNNMDDIYEKYKYLTGIIPKRNNKYYEHIYNDIKNDFIQAKKANPDIIVVLAHMGEQFYHHTTEFQDKWNKIFSELGADIILGDHSHTVQPLEYLGKTLIINSPGNFANSYIENDGDSTAIIDIYIHKELKKVLGSSVIPMYTKEIRSKFFSAIPIYDLIKNKIIELSQKEKKRVEEIQEMSTKVLVGKAIGIREVKKNYYFINNSYYDFDKGGNNFCSDIVKYKNKNFYQFFNNSNSITFIGDSITEGTINGHHPWYEPIINCFTNKKIINISKGSFTTKLIIKQYKEDIIKSNSDLYIFAIGANDIRYRKSLDCSMNSSEYIKKIEEIVNLTKCINSKFVFIAPWISTPKDYASKLNHFEKKKLIKQYSLELENYAKKRNNYIFINANDYLEERIKINEKKYLLDYIHPNNNFGIELYSEGVLANSP